MLTAEVVAELDVEEISTWTVSGFGRSPSGSGRVKIRLSHPLAPEFGIDVLEDLDRRELRARLLDDPYFQLFNGAPVGEPHELLADLHSVAEGLAWSLEGRRGLGYVLRDHGLLDEQEVRWFTEESTLRGAGAD